MLKLLGFSEWPCLRKIFVSARAAPPWLCMTATALKRDPDLQPRGHRQPCGAHRWALWSWRSSQSTEPRIPGHILWQCWHITGNKWPVLYVFRVSIETYQKIWFDRVVWFDERMCRLDSSSDIFTNIFKYILAFLEFSPQFNRLEHFFQSHDLFKIFLG